MRVWRAGRHQHLPPSPNHCRSQRQHARGLTVQCVAAPEQGEGVLGDDGARRAAPPLPPPVGGAAPSPPAAAALLPPCWPCLSHQLLHWMLQCTHAVKHLVQSPHNQPAACTALPAVTTRVQRNKNMAKLQAGYLFPEVRPGVLVAGPKPRAHAAASL